MQGWKGAAPVVEVHGGGEGVMGVHDRADAAREEGHPFWRAILLAQLLGGACCGSVGFGWHAAIHH